MSFWLLFEKLHGHVAVLAIALCYHPPIALRRVRRPGRGVRRSAYLATLMLSAGMGAGWFIYPEYRRSVRQDLYLMDPALGHLFELKEHLGTYAFFVALAGAILVALSRRAGGAELTRAIRLCYGVAALLATAVGLAGIRLASTVGFAYPQ